MGGKRDQEGQSNEGKSKRQKSKFYSGGKRSFTAGIPPGLEGFLVTCNGGREVQCSREVIILLEHFWEEKENSKVSVSEKSDALDNGTKLGEEEKGKEVKNEDQFKDFEKLLESEVDDLKKPNNKVNFSFVDTGCKGLVFIKLKRPNREGLDPDELAEIVVRDTVTTMQARTRYTMKLMPAEVTCYASVPEICQAIKPLVEKHFPSTDANDKAFKYAVLVDARAHSGLDKMAIINAVAALVPSPHTVDLNKPQKTIIVQILKTACTIGVCRDFRELSKYNLRQIICPDEVKENNVEGKEEKEKIQAALDGNVAS